MRRQSSRIAVFLQADARPMFCWPRSASTARSQVWLGLPNGRFQSGCSPQITTVTARWWSSCGELWAICPKSRKRLSMTRWERGWHPVVALTSTFVTWRVYGILRILPTCQMHQCESTGALWWTMFRTHTTRQGLCKSGRGGFWYPAWCLTSRFFFSSKFMQDPAMAIWHTGPHLCCHQRSWSCYPDRQRCRPFQHDRLPPGLLSKAWMGEPGVFWVSTSLSKDQRPPPLPASCL